MIVRFEIDTLDGIGPEEGEALLVLFNKKPNDWEQVYIKEVGVTEKFRGKVIVQYSKSGDVIGTRLEVNVEGNSHGKDFNDMAEFLDSAEKKGLHPIFKSVGNLVEAYLNAAALADEFIAALTSYK